MLTSITDQLKISTVATDIYIDRYLPANVLNTMHEIISESVTYKQKYQKKIQAKFEEFQAKIKSEELSDKSAINRMKYKCLLNKSKYTIPDIEVKENSLDSIDPRVAA